MAYDKTNKEKKERALFGKDAISIAKKNLKQIMETSKPLVMKKGSIQRYNEEQLIHVIYFILHKDNVCLFAWGSKKKVIKRTGEIVDSFPDCARKRLVNVMYNRYESPTVANKLLGKSTFLDLVHILTVNNNRVVRAIDYVQVMLLNEPCGTLQPIIDDLISDLSMKKTSREC